MRKLIFLFVLFISADLSAQSGWQSTFDNNPHMVYKLVKCDANTIYGFCANSKFFLISTNNGESWENRQTFDSAYSISEACFLNSLTGWVAAYSTKSHILRTTNGGLNWSEVIINPLDFYYSRIFFLNQNTGWITGYQKLYKTTDTGFSWNYTEDQNLVGSYAIKFLNASTGFIGGYSNTNGYILKTTNAGNSWSNICTGSQLLGTYVTDIQVISADEIIGIGQAPYPDNSTLICRTSNSGTNWQTIKNIPSDNTSKYFSSLNFINSLTGFSFGSRNYILKTTDAGISWSEINTNLITSLNSLIFLDPNSILMGGGYYPAGGFDLYNYILKSTNQGNNWVIKNNSYYNNFSDIYFKDYNNGIAVSGGGMIYRTSNAGTNWIKILADSSYPISKFAPVNKDTLFATGSYSGIIFRTTNFGQNWSRIVSPDSSSVSSMEFINSSIGFGICNNQIIKSINGGKSWNYLTNNPMPPNYFLINKSFLNENTGWILGSYNIYQPGPHVFWWTKLYKTSDGGNTWTLIYDENYTSTTLHSIKILNENFGYAVHSSNALMKTTNNGLSWELMPAANFGADVSSVKMLNSQTGWCGGKKVIDWTNYSAVYKTTNGGYSWGYQFYEKDRSINTFFIANENNVWFCGEKNSIFKTTDGGGTIIGVNQISSQVPKQFSLSQNYPNPFNPSTRINYELKITNYVTLKVFDLLGKEVASLVNEKQPAGSYAVDFNSEEYNLPSGIYFYTLNAGEFKETRKMVLVK